MTTEIVGIVLVHDEDVFVERAIRNVAAFCDRIHVADHLSTDRTWDVVSALARELEHVDAARIRHARRSHELIERYAGTDTWVFKVDGDELYDPLRLARFRAELLDGAYRDVFRVYASGLNCVELDRERGLASGYLAPPSRQVGAVYNFGAIDAWRGCPERLHGGEVAFRPGYDWDSHENLGTRYAWEEAPLRYLHACFLRRSSGEREGGQARSNLAESRAYRRGLLGRLERRARTALGRGAPAAAAGWKDEKYRRGELVTRDVSAFLGPEGIAQPTA